MDCSDRPQSDALRPLVQIALTESRLAMMNASQQRGVAVVMEGYRSINLGFNPVKTEYFHADAVT